MEVRYRLGTVLLLREDFACGWKECERRLKLDKFRNPFSQLLWDASDLNGRVLFLLAEQGFGDTIQSIRFLPIVLKTDFETFKTFV